MNESPNHLAVRCPCCQTDLTVESRSGKVVEQLKPSGDRPDWDQLVSTQEQKKKHTERRFDQERAAVARAKQPLDQSFEQAIKEAMRDSPKRPPSPFDLD